MSFSICFLFGIFFIICFICLNDLTSLLISSRVRALPLAIRFRLEGVSWHSSRCSAGGWSPADGYRGGRMEVLPGRAKRERKATPGLNYLCAGYEDYFGHVTQPMRTMGELLRRRLRS